jgi:hypothetical protein
VKLIFSFEIAPIHAKEERMSRRIQFFRSKLPILVFAPLLTLHTASALTVLVPTDSATVQGGVNMAGPGDTVLIENSATYVESVAIQEVITVMAAAGQTPTLLYDSGATSPASYMVYIDTPGAQFGSNAGGQILLDGACNTNVTTFLQSNITTGEVIFENLRCINSTPSAYFIFPDPDPPGDTGIPTTATFTFNDVVGEGVGCNLAGPTARFDDPDFLIRPDFLEGSTIQLTRCEFTGADRMCILHGGGDTIASYGNVIIDQSYLSGRELAITSEPAPRALAINWTVTDSLLESTIDPIESGIFGTFAPWWVRAPEQVIGCTRTVFLENGLGRSFLMFPGDDSLITFDHCDFVSFNGVPFEIDPPTLALPRNISIRNCNLIGFNEEGNGPEPGISGGVVGLDVFNNDYNNVLSGYDGLELVKPEIMGANDIIPAVTPDYTDPRSPGLNYQYTDPTLLTGDEIGGPVGSFRFFGAPPVPTPIPIPASDVSDWSLYE